MLNYSTKEKVYAYFSGQTFCVLTPFINFYNVNFSPVTILSIILIGLLFYFLFLHHRSYKESRIIHIVQRLLPRRLYKGIRRKELRKIIREKDAVVLDRFDKLIKTSLILDFEEGITLNGFFDKVSEIVSKRLKIDRDKICKLLWERERESSTVITPGLAIPHIIIPGEKIFDIVLVRCNKGIIFHGESPPVNIVFILIGTKDERNFHLKALAAIAQIAQDKKFYGKWLKAKTVEELRKIILLTERKRLGLK